MKNFDGDHEQLSLFDLPTPGKKRVTGHFEVVVCEYSNKSAAKMDLNEMFKEGWEPFRSFLKDLTNNFYVVEYKRPIKQEVK